MGAPSELPVWATAGTNNGEPDATQKNNGWGVEQDAVSSYFNWWMNNVYLWILWLSAGLTFTGWQWSFPYGPTPDGMTWVVIGSSQYALAGGSGSNVSVSITVPVGYQITDVGVSMKGSHTFLATINKHVQNDIADTTALAGTSGGGIATLTGTATGSWTKFTGALTTAETVVDGTNYTILLTLGAGDKCNGVGFKIRPVP